MAEVGIGVIALDVHVEAFNLQQDVFGLDHLRAAIGPIGHVNDHYAARFTGELEPGEGFGVVTSPNGAEAGVWVIAETTDLPTKFVRIVVTDDMGRYLVPDLPKANYNVWVRGYGLVDSPKVKAAPGTTLNLKAVLAPDKKAATEYYPALYWFSLLQVPPKSDFPGTGPGGNGIASNVRSQGEWIRQIVNTDGCTGCHQMGDKATREIPKSILNQSADTKAAWDLRIKAGQAGGGMSARFDQVGRKRVLAMYADLM